MKKYDVSKQFKHEVDVWAYAYNIFATEDDEMTAVTPNALFYMPAIVDCWIYDINNNGAFDSNERFIAIMRYLNGEDVFEVVD